MNQTIDLDIYVENAKLKEQYRLLHDDYRKKEFQIRSANQIIQTLKSELLDMTEILIKLKKENDNK
jgi:hypothetical protein